jgi:hypothetical protein
MVGHVVSIRMVRTSGKYEESPPAAAQVAPVNASCSAIR